MRFPEQICPKTAISSSTATCYIIPLLVMMCFFWKIVVSLGLLVGIPEATATKDEEADQFKGTEMQPCDLCVGGSMGLRWPGAFIDTHGTTCVDHLIDMFYLDPKSNECRWNIIRHRNRCCGEDPPEEPIDQIPTESPQGYEGSGG